MFRPLVLTVLVLLAGTACSEPPLKERHQAEGALAAARAAEAAVYAPGELKAAEDALARYEAAVAARDYRQALNHALEARDLAADAARHASDRKAVARSRAEQLMAEVESLSADATARLALRGATRPPAALATRLRAAIRAAAPALREARSLVEQHQYQAAQDRLSPIAEHLRSLATAGEATGSGALS